MKKCNFKRLFCLLLTLATVAVLCPAAPSVQADSAAATVDGQPYSSLETAVAAAGAGSVVQLQQNATVSELEILSDITLDLNGCTLTADDFTSTAGDVIDTSALSAGKLVCSSVALATDNAYLPITKVDGIHFAEVGFTQWIQPLEEDVTKVKFYFPQQARDTILDNVISAGSDELGVQLHLSWKNASGASRETTATFSNQLMREYAAQWDNRVFVVTITGTSDITELCCTWQVTSAAAAGTTISAETIQSAGYIHEKLTWDAINSYPIKTTDMTVAEMRQLCVDFMEFSKTYLWTPDTSVIDFIRTDGGGTDNLYQGTIYGGLPYITYGSGNPYRMMDYIDPATGLLDMHKAMPALGTKDQLALEDVRYFGSQCSFGAYWAWGRVINSTTYRWTSWMVPSNGFVYLGNITVPENLTNWNSSDGYGTDDCVTDNGKQTMFAAYAQLQKADGLVTQTDTNGHTVMAYTDATVNYKWNGTINGATSYVYIIDQATAWEEETNDSGDTYLRKNRIGTKRTFEYLYEEGYIPFTFAEFQGTNAIEVTEVSLKNNTTVYSTGTVDETTRRFDGTQNTSFLNWAELFSSTVASNYGIADAYITFTDNSGKELYRHAVRVRLAGEKTLALVETGTQVTTWETQTLTVGETYHASIEVQLATGERPVIWEGTVRR